MGSAVVVGAGGLSAMAVGLSASGPPGTTSIPTSFGQVRVTSAQRQSRLSGEAGAAHGGHRMAGSSSPQPVNMTYGDHLVLRVDAVNESDDDVLFSPGQIRVRPDSQPWLVVNRGSDLPAGALPAGGRASASISFLVPSDAARFSVQFDDMAPGSPPLDLPLPAVAWRPGYLEADHA
ncbi:hypothetical protein ACX8Z9_05695 [Arthrobacter halodurans]